MECAQSFKDSRTASRLRSDKQISHHNECDKSCSKNFFIYSQSNKDFRKTANIKKKIYQGNNERKVYLPGEDFTYGKKIPSTATIESLIQYDFSNKAEDVIKKEYHTYLREVEVIMNSLYYRELRLIN